MRRKSIINESSVHKKLKFVVKAVYKEHYAFIDRLRVFAAFGVIVIHMAGPFVTNEKLFLENNFSWWAANFLDSFSRWSVPVFVMISGFLLISEKSFTEAGNFYQKRIKRMLEPLLFWSIFYIIFNIIDTGYFSPKDILSSLFIGEPYYHLWYLYMIIGVYSVAPLLSLIHLHFNLNQRVKIIIIILFAGALNNAYVKYFDISNQFFVFRFFPYIGYFMLGKEISNLKIPIPNNLYLLLIFITSIAIALITGLLKILHFNTFTLFYDYLNPLVIIQSMFVYLFFHNKFTLVNSKRSNSGFNMFSNLTLGIYVIHPVFIVIMFRLLKTVEYNTLFILPLLMIFVFFISSATIFIVSKIPFLNKVI